MEDTWIVFIVGTVASYCLIYLGFTRLMGRRTKKSSVRRGLAITKAQRQFIDALREEAISRVDDALGTAIKALSGRNADRAGVSGGDSDVISRLGETRRTVQSLFNSEVVAAYDNVIAALTRPSSSVAELKKGTMELRTKMHAHLEPHSRSPVVDQHAIQ